MNTSAMFAKVFIPIDLRVQITDCKSCVCNTSKSLAQVLVIRELHGRFARSEFCLMWNSAVAHKLLITRELFGEVWGSAHSGGVRRRGTHWRPEKLLAGLRAGIHDL